MNTLPLNNRTLGTTGLICAPFMMISMLLMEQFPDLKKTAFDGLSGLVFMLPWMGSLVGLLRLNAAGNSLFGRWIIPANLITLTLANCWNVYNAVEPWAGTPLFWFLDAFWPISMLTMLLVGITVARAGVLQGWRRYVPLAVGLWLPVTALAGKLTELIVSPGAAGGTLIAMSISGIYGTVCWGLMAYLVRTTPQVSQQTFPSVYTNAESNAINY
ncbi:hypothetical protein GCM10027341_02030 [Spirosoma knui]